MSLMRSMVPKILLASLLMSVCLRAASAQDVRYKTTSKTDVQALGFIGGLFNGEHQEEVTIKGLKMRSDRKDQSTITDLDGERFININHKKKEYSIMTFADMAELMKSLPSKMEQGKSQESKEEGEADYEVKFNLEVKDTGKSKKIDGHNTKEKVLIIETRFVPKGESADTLPSGAIYAVNDMWLASHIPEMEPAEEFQRKAGEIMSENMASTDMAGIINQLLGSYPGVDAAMERSKEEVTKLDGFPLESTMYLVSVPADMDLDLELALGEKKQEKKEGGGFGGFLKKMASQAQGVPSGEEGSKPEQKTLLSVFSSTKDISNKSVEASYFDPPAGYKEVEYESPLKEMQKD